MDALNKTLGPWEPETWECLREIVQELFEGNGQPDAEVPEYQYRAERTF